METQTKQASITASTETSSSPSMQTVSDVQNVSPALERYMRAALFGDLWNRPDLSPRDRSIVTLAALIARSQTLELPAYLDLALGHGVTAAEISEIITHLAFYAGWGTAMAAVAAAKDIFARRGIGVDQLPGATDLGTAARRCSPRAPGRSGRRPPERGSRVAPRRLGPVAAVGARRRPDLAPRDRSLVTVSALIAAGQVAQIPFHLNRAMDNGLTKAQASEVLTHLAFYAGWPNAMSAVPVVKGVFEARSA
jgi:4-carboxymuconolactone decarboxylase